MVDENRDKNAGSRANEATPTGSIPQVITGTVKRYSEAKGTGL
jgi:hypothetical protein